MARARLGSFSGLRQQRWLLSVVLSGVLMPLPTRLVAQRDVTRQRSLSEDLQLFSQVLNHIRLNHPDSVDLHVLVLAAIQGMVEAADPHSWVIPSLRLDPDKEDALAEGRHIRLPVKFEFVGGAPLVVSIDPGTEVSRGDVYPGDVLLEVDGNPVSAESSEELALDLSGPEGEELLLTLERWSLDGSRLVLTRSVRREKAGEGTAVSGGTVLDDGTGYVRILSFEDGDVADELQSDLERLKESGMTSLVLDLRDNAGGRLDQAARVAGVFLPRGAVVYTSEGRREAVTDTVRVERSFLRHEERYPVAVLVNEGTASAAELVAATLQDHDRGIVVGRPTFGKALVTSPFVMSDGSILMLVVGKIRTPCGRIIQRPYRGIPVSRYLALAGLDPDTTGLPSCRSDSGRILYGGGGIHPDRLLPPLTPPPAWWVFAEDLNLRTRWAGSFVTEFGPALASAATFMNDTAITSAMLRTFRMRAEEEGLELQGAADAALLGYLLPEVARVRWGLAEAIRVSAHLDPAVAAAARAARNVPDTGN